MITAVGFHFPFSEYLTHTTSRSRRPSTATYRSRDSSWFENTHATRNSTDAPSFERNAALHFGHPGPRTPLHAEKENWRVRGSGNRTVQSGPKTQPRRRRPRQRQRGRRARAQIQNIARAGRKISESECVRERERERQKRKAPQRLQKKLYARGGERSLRRSTIAARLNGLKVRLCKRRNGEG